ncbi:MAG: hypothetical protein KUG77_16655 [Nannocystaceae bacterium]|nr:hypothetical protein [Nannocystaceae bacterium]
MNLRTSNCLRLLSVGVLASLIPTPVHATNPGEMQLPGRIQRILEAGDANTFFIVTDKPLYHPGETVWFRGFELNRRSISPRVGPHGVTYKLVGPSGETVQEKRVEFNDGVAANDFELPPSLPGGRYRVHARSDDGPEHELEVQVSAYELPQIKKQLKFVRESYSAGDYVVAEVHVARPTGEAMATKIDAVLTIGARPPKSFVRYSGADGDAKVGFRLPKDLANEEVRLTLTVKAGGAAESIERRVPIASDRVELTVRPEGGDLVYGLPSRVYLQAADDTKSATRAKGRVVDDLGHEVAKFSTYHDGMARFTMTPVHGRTYHVEFTKPQAATVHVDFPKPRVEGCTMRSVDDFKSNNRDVWLRVRCTSPQPILATAVLRGKLVAHRVKSIPTKGATIRLPIARGMQGAMQVTLFDEEKTPLAERALYRGLGSGLNIKIRTNAKQYNPRDEVTMSIETTNARGEPVAADLVLAVVDDTVLSFADDDAAEILARMYLQPELGGQEVEDPNFYYSDDEKAPRALDLLLGVKGYRQLR